jgi:hypothetical protein
VSKPRSPWSTGVTGSPIIICYCAAPPSIERSGAKRQHRCGARRGSSVCFRRFPTRRSVWRVHIRCCSSSCSSFMCMGQNRRPSLNLIREPPNHRHGAQNKTVALYGGVDFSNLRLARQEKARRCAVKRRLQPIMTPPIAAEVDASVTCTSVPSPLAGQTDRMQSFSILSCTQRRLAAFFFPCLAL